MRLSVSADTAKGVRQLAATAASLRRARIRAINKLRDQAKTAGFRKVNDIYQIGPSILEPYATITQATDDSASASISVKGQGFRLTAFKPIQTARGVSILVKGRRIVLPHTFISQRYGQVVARGKYAYQGKSVAPTGDQFSGFIFGKKRLPLTELLGMQPGDAFGNPLVLEAMQDRVDEQAFDVLRREVEAVSRGF